MQKVKLKLKHNQYLFFCPVTGQQVLFPGKVEPSSAMLFFFNELFGEFQFAQPGIMKKYSRCETACDLLTENKDPFEMLINETLGDEYNYVMFTLISPEKEADDEWGPYTEIVHIAFDMDYCENNK